MNLGYVAQVLAGFLAFFSLSLVLPLAVSFGEVTDLPMTGTFAATLATGLGIAGALWYAGRGHGRDFFRKDGLVVVGMAWLLTGALAAAPFLWSGAIPRFADAFFESISGLTTTGATVLGTANRDIDSLPASLLLWRSMLQWMGGLGIVLVFIVVFPAMGVTGSRLLSSEQVGSVSDGSTRPRMAAQARLLFWLYVGLTATAGIGYWLAGLSPFDSICHAMTTAASGGFSPHNVSIGGYRNLGVELVAIVCMFLAGCNFLLLAHVLTGGRRVILTTPLQATEFRVYLVGTLSIILLLAVTLWIWGQPIQDRSLGFTRDYGQFARCLRDAAFQTVSLITSTGYSSANYENWPKPALYLLIVCMFVGGCAGSTAGGFKILRVVVCAKLVGYALRHFVRPRAVGTLKVGSEALADRVITAILALLLLWVAGTIVGTFVLSLDPRLDFMSAFVTSLSMMSCIGPSMSEVLPAGDGTFALVGEIDVGPYGGYGELQSGAKLFMSLQMILGRLEILAPLALLTPGFWRR